jgi:hypothetical protein
VGLEPGSIDPPEPVSSNSLLVAEMIMGMRTDQRLFWNHKRIPKLLEACSVVFWIYDDESEWPLCFEKVCAQFDLDPGALIDFILEGKNPAELLLRTRFRMRGSYWYETRRSA